MNANAISLEPGVIVRSGLGVHSTDWTNDVFSQLQDSCLLPEVTAQDQGKICVVIDLDETLVHSSFKVPQLVFFM